MNRFLLAATLLGVSLTASAQNYNYFDAADVDADGWLWFDSQAKIDKYVGFGANYKIQLQPVGYQDTTGEYAEPWADPEIPGYNISGEEAGEGAKYGAIVLNPGSTSSGNGSDNPDGGGFMMWLPDCAKFDLFLSSPNNVIVVGLKAGMGDWVKAVDCALVRSWMKMGSWVKPLASEYQYQFNDIQNYANANAPYTTIASEKGKKVTALFTNNGKELYVHGIRVLTYSANEASIQDVNSESNLEVNINEGIVSVNQEAAISVYDLMGHEMANVKGVSLSLQSLPSGIYLVKATNAHDSATVKVRR